MANGSDRLVWMDCEMTGLDLEADELVEIAVIVTGFDLVPLDKGLTVVIRPSEAALEQMGEFVRDMHTASGLIEELDGGLDIDAAQDAVLGYITGHVPTPQQAPLAGNSIATDRAFLARQLPLVDAHLHYRNVDVSSIKELTRRWFPRIYFNAPAKDGGHRAMADILESIRELRYYREAVFVSEPGPSTEEVQRIAQSVVESFAAELY